MKKSLFFLSILLFFGWHTSALAASDSVIISEVLFDPSGTDTGLEYIAIKNIGTSVAELTGWSLYPDGVGYFTFPSFMLSPGATVKIVIRGSGADSAHTLYFSGASGNIGNSSGSVALFSSSTHSSDTIVSFVRYQKLGSGERKTWESTAASAGLWAVGTFVDVSSLIEGQGIMLSHEKSRANASSWSVGAVSSDSGNTDSQSLLSSNQDVVSGSVPSSAYNAPAIESKIKVYAGADMTAMVGASMVFTASAEDLSGRALDGARFLWNFGDGTYKEGRSVTHIFRYPGRYAVVVDVSAGIYSASDTMVATIVENPVVISEIMPSQEKGFFASLLSSDHGGWIEFYNGANFSIDISGIGISLDDTHRFFFPASSMLSARSVIVVGDGVLGFNVPKKGEIKFLYANGSVMSLINFDATLIHSGQSVIRNGDTFIVATATPGALTLSSESQFVTVTPMKTKTPEKMEPIKKEDKNVNSLVKPRDSESPTQLPYEASAIGAVGGGRSFLGFRALYPLGVGTGIALLATMLIYVIKSLLTRYTKN